MSDSVTAVDPVAEPVPSTTPATGREVWADRLRRFASSGLTITAFCKAEGVRTQAFYHWRAKLAVQDAPADRPSTAPDAPRFVPVRLRPDHPPVEVVLPTGVILRLSAGCDLAFVRAVLDALGDTLC
jgi:hypothetical protein